ncbi:hypothetical protein [Microbacterium maritypicum]
MPEHPLNGLHVRAGLFQMPDGTYMLKSDILAAESRGDVGLDLGNGERSPFCELATCTGTCSARPDEQEL